MPIKCLRCDDVLPSNTMGMPLQCICGAITVVGDDLQLRVFRTFGDGPGEGYEFVTEDEAEKARRKGKLRGKE